MPQHQQQPRTSEGLLVNHRVGDCHRSHLLASRFQGRGLEVQVPLLLLAPRSVGALEIRMAFFFFCFFFFGGGVFLLRIIV